MGNGDYNKGDLSNTFRTYSEAQGGGEPAYKRQFRSKDDRWRARDDKPIRAGIFGISTGSDFATRTDKLDRGLHSILQQVDNLYVSNTYGPYQHVFVKEGMTTEQAMDRAFQVASDWLAENISIIYHYKAEAKKQDKSVKMIEWTDDIRQHPDFMDRLTDVHNFYYSCEAFAQVIRDDIDALRQRQLKRGEITQKDLEDSTFESSAFNPYIRSALEKVAGYSLMCDELKKRTGCDEIAYFHNGPVSPQIDFFRTNPQDIPPALASMNSLVYVDISFKSKKPRKDQDAGQDGEQNEGHPQRRQGDRKPSSP